MINREEFMSEHDDNVAESSRHPEWKAYWKATVSLTLTLLVIWFVVSFGAGILFRDALDAFSIGGAPLGFWFAQQGAIYTFVVLIFVYCFRMNALERKYGIKG
jgi:putative solute:sodium symporter small subunit